MIAQPEVREQIKEADITFGVNAVTEESTLFYGKEMLQGIIKRKTGKQLVIIAFRIDYETGELEYLHAAIQVLKSDCCYDECCYTE